VSFDHCTFRDNNSIYGTIFDDASGGYSELYVENCAFDNNTSATSGGAIYTYAYGGGEAYPYISNCVFNNNQAASHGGAIYNNGYLGEVYIEVENSTFHGNEAGTSAGAIYNFGSSGTCETTVDGSIFYDNANAGDADHKFSEFYNYQANHTVSYSSMQRSSGTYTTGTLNYLGGGANNYYQTSPGFADSSDGDGADNVWRTGDDGLRLSSSSALINKAHGTAPDDDILGGTKVGIRDMGAYEYITCGLNVVLATDVATHTATHAANDGNFTCYCNSNNELLLALDTNGTGAVITPSQVKLYIGNPSTLSYNSAGGMISNTAGGVVLERRWDVDPTTQPSSNVTVRYFYTNDEYKDIVTAMAALTSPTTISSPSQLQFYKVKGGSTATFPNPHDAGVYGIVLTHGISADTNVWVAGVHGVQDHTSEYVIENFSGGGGGGGGGSAPLPVDLIEFTVTAHPIHIAQLNWTTASEINNSHFEVERSYDATNFEVIHFTPGHGSTNEIQEYSHLDNTINPNQNVVHYRLRQVDFDGTEAYSPIKHVEFSTAYTFAEASVYPNPTKGVVTIVFNPKQKRKSHQIIVMDNVGRIILKTTTSNRTIDVNLSGLSSGIYFITLDSGENFKVVKQ